MFLFDDDGAAGSGPHLSRPHRPRTRPPHYLRPNTHKYSAIQHCGRSANKCCGSRVRIDLGPRPRGEGQFDGAATVAVAPLDPFLACCFSPFGHGAVFIADRTAVYIWGQPHCCLWDRLHRCLWDRPHRCSWGRPAAPSPADPPPQPCGPVTCQPAASAPCGDLVWQPSMCAFFSKKKGKIQELDIAVADAVRKSAVVITGVPVKSVRLRPTHVRACAIRARTWWVLPECILAAGIVRAVAKMLQRVLPRWQSQADAGGWVVVSAWAHHCCSTSNRLNLNRNIRVYRHVHKHALHDISAWPMGMSSAAGHRPVQSLPQTTSVHPYFFTFLLYF